MASNTKEVPTAAHCEGQKGWGKEHSALAVASLRHFRWGIHRTQLGRGQLLVTPYSCSSSDRSTHIRTRASRSSPPGPATGMICATREADDSVVNPQSSSQLEGLHVDACMHTWLCPCWCAHSGSGSAPLLSARTSGAVGLHCNIWHQRSVLHCGCVGVAVRRHLVTDWCPTSWATCVATGQVVRCVAAGTRAGIAGGSSLACRQHHTRPSVQPCPGHSGRVELPVVLNSSCLHHLSNLKLSCCGTVLLP
jgi:hypothetical protein